MTCSKSFCSLSMLGVPLPMPTMLSRNRKGLTGSDLYGRKPGYSSPGPPPSIQNFAPWTMQNVEANWALKGPPMATPLMWSHTLFPTTNNELGCRSHSTQLSTSAKVRFQKEPLSPRPSLSSSLCRVYSKSDGPGWGGRTPCVPSLTCAMPGP